VARKLTDTVKLQVRLSERLRRQLEQAAKHHRQSMNTEIVDRLYVSFEKEAQEKEMGSMVEQAIDSAATGAVKRLVRELRENRLIPDQMAQPQEATEHLAAPDKEEHPE
jgi:hypothetical protein